MSDDIAIGSAHAKELCSFNEDNVLHLDKNNGSTLTKGTVIGQTANIIATIGAEDIYKPTIISFTVDNNNISGGLQGGNNPKDANDSVPNTTLQEPVNGAFIQFEVKANGYLYILHKASSNKAYTVFENGKAISYTFAAVGGATTDLGEVYQYTLPYEIENGQKVVQQPIEWAEREYLKSAKPDVYTSRLTTDADGTEIWNGDDLKKNGSGVIKFSVFAGRKYIVNANGSKITTAGFAFSTDDNLTIKDGDIIIYGAGRR
jgi:hypothetical protein